MDGTLSGRFDESHRDQCLAGFGNAGLSLRSPLRFDQGKDSTLDSVLQDSLATFDRTQKEIEWTAIAYAFYLPPTKTWHDRFGDLHSFDELALELIQRPLFRSTCGGFHRIQAVADIVGADVIQPLLSPEVRQKAIRWMDQFIVKLEQEQLPDGSWGPDWTRSMDSLTKRPVSQSLDSVSDRLLITSHATACILTLPPNSAPDPATTSRAVQWLRTSLRKGKPESYWDAVCPFTHTLEALRQ